VPIQRMLAARRFALLAPRQDNVAGVAFVFFFGQLDLVQIGIEHGSLRGAIERNAISFLDN